jgi:dienelactone hydrolase
MTMLSFRLLLIGVLAAPLLGAQPTPASRTAAILLLQGSDTVVVERFTRSAREVTASVAVRGQPRIDLRFEIGADHLVPSTTFTVFGPNAPVDAAPLQRGTLTLRPDSAILTIDGGGASRTIRVATRPGALPLLNNEFVVAEQAVRIAQARGMRSLTFPVFALSAAVTLDATLDLVGADSARFTVAGNVTEVAIDAAGQIVGGRLPASSGIRLAVVEGAAAAAISLGRTDYSAPTGAPYEAIEVSVPTAAGHLLSGTLTRPLGARGRLPAVVTITGSGQQDRDEYIPIAGGVRLFRQIADTLSRRGIAVLRLDDRGVGGSGGDVNGTSADFADDIRAAVTWLRARAEIDPARIALVGHSEGGMIAPMIAADDAKLAAIALLAGPAYTGQKIIDFQLENVVRGDSSIAPSAKDSLVRVSRAQFDSLAERSAWMRYFLAYDPLPTIRRVRQPVLILQGATDQQIRAEEARLLEATLRAAGNRRVTLAILPERNHLFLRDPVGHPSGYQRLPSNRVDGEVLGTLAEWVVRTLGPATR